LFFFLKKKKKKEKKKEGNWSHLMAGLGVVEPPPWPKGWSGHAQKKLKVLGCFFLFGPFGGGQTTPYGWYGVVEATPRPLGVAGQPPKVQNLFFFFGLPFRGVAKPIPRAWGWLDHPLGHGGGSTPFLAKGPISFYFPFFFFFDKTTSF
jgi:hypothetical protein